MADVLHLFNMDISDQKQDKQQAANHADNILTGNARLKPPQHTQPSK
jgi:hypothetical protein